MSASNDGAESVDAFLQRIASTRVKRDDEGDGRRRRLEDEILQGRSERQARRAERAKSLSPVKRPHFQASPPSSATSRYRELNPEYPSNSAVTVSQSHESSAFELSPSPRTAKPAAQDTILRSLPSSPSRSSPLSNQTATALSRSGTLSWQQRPSSRDSNIPRGRPFSRQIDHTDSPGSASVNETRTRDQTGPLRHLKDPSWSLKIEDRGAGSPVRGKSTEEPKAAVERRPRPLPQVPRKPDIEIDNVRSPLYSKDESGPPIQPGPATDADGWSNTLSSKSSKPTSSPFPTHHSQRLPQPAEALGSDHGGSQLAGMSTGQGGSSRDRSTSPTKGLGGFVQSAMMKRSDSVNKRWSAKAAPRLSRGNSMMGFRGSKVESASAMSAPESPPREGSRSSPGPSSSPLAASRPTSTHGTSKVPYHAESPTRQSLPPSSFKDTLPPARPADHTSNTSTRQDGSKDESLGPRSSIARPLAQHPVSPTKTIDPKRWSPTKASWLESALSKPEASKLASPKPQTPSWMVDLEKQKSPSNDAKSVRSPTSGFSVASSTGLVRSPPLGGPPEGSSSSSARRNSPEKSAEAVVKWPKPLLSNITATTDEMPPLSSEARVAHRKSPEAELESKPIEAEIPSPTIPVARKEPAPSPKETPHTPPNTDFRTNLRSRQARSDERSSGEPEFKNAFAKLRRTETKKYVAPDELKDNILRGKAALNLTGGPQKSHRVDEFKESILKKKESMKGGASTSHRSLVDDNQSPPASRSSTNLSEALTMRNTLNKHRVSVNETQPVAKPDTLLSSRTSNFPAARYTTSLSNDLPANDDFRSTGAANGGSIDVAASKPKAQNTLADRLNSHLAGVVLRDAGYPEKGKQSRPIDLGDGQRRGAPSAPRESHGCPTADLTHMTKARAKGPKRRLPKTAGLDDLGEAS